MASTCPVTSSTNVPLFAARGYGYPTGLDACEAAKLANLYSREASYPSTFGGVAPFNYERLAGVPSTFDRFGGSMQWANAFSGVPSTYERFGGVPSTWNTWGVPSTFDRFGGVPSSWNNWGLPSTYERFGAYPSTFGGYMPWANTFSGIPSTSDRVSGLANNSSLCNIAFRPSHEVEYYTLTNPIRILDREGNRMVVLCFDLKGYKPEEITVTLNKTERAIIVDASSDCKDGKEHHVTRKLSRKFVLPESLSKVDLTKVELKSCLNVEGLLTVDCSLPKMTSEEIAKCPTMSKIFNELPYYSSPSSYSCGISHPGQCNTANINAKPVTVKTA